MLLKKLCLWSWAKVNPQRTPWIGSMSTSKMLILMNNYSQLARAKMQKSKNNIKAICPRRRELRLLRKQSSEKELNVRQRLKLTIMKWNFLESRTRKWRSKHKENTKKRNSKKTCGSRKRRKKGSRMKNFKCKFNWREIGAREWGYHLMSKKLSQSSRRKSRSHPWS